MYVCFQYRVANIHGSFCVSIGLFWSYIGPFWYVCSARAHVLCVCVCACACVCVCVMVCACMFKRTIHQNRFDMCVYVLALLCMCVCFNVPSVRTDLTKHLFKGSCASRGKKISISEKNKTNIFSRHEHNPLEKHFVKSAVY